HRVDVPGPDAGDQAELGIVGETQRLVDFPEAKYRQDRTEHFLLDDGRRPVYPVHDGRLVEEAAPELRGVRTRASDEDLCARVPGPVDMLGDPRQLDMANDRPDVEILDPWAQPQRGELLDEASHDLVVHLVLHEQTRAGGTRLPSVLDDRIEHAPDRRIDLGLREDQVRGLATGLDHGRDQVLGDTTLDV